MAGEVETGRVEVIAPCRKAYEHMTHMLFPFSFEKWLILAFVAFLVAPAGSGFNLPVKPDRHEGFVWSWAGDDVAKAVSFIEKNVAVVVVAAVFCAAIYLLMAYISSRALFIYMDCAVDRRAAFVEPWKRGAGFANSFFLSRMVIDLVGGGILAVVLVVAAFAAWPHLRTGSMTAELVGILLVTALFAGPALAALFVARWVNANLVASIMYVRETGAMAAWGELLRLAKGRLTEFVLYGLVNFGLMIAYWALLVPAACCTCCIGMLPVAHHMLFQPFFLWWRAYPFHFLAQFGGRYAERVKPVEAFAPTQTAESAPGPVTVAAPPAARVANCTHCGQPHQVLGGAGVYVCSRCGARFEVA
jgi:hypothetical protein